MKLVEEVSSDGEPGSLDPSSCPPRSTYSLYSGGTGGTSIPYFGAMDTSLSRSCVSGGGGEEEGSVAGSPPSSMNPSNPAGVLSTSALAGVSPAFLCMWRRPLGK